jgi:AraC-like DNA-binding protein
LYLESKALELITYSMAQFVSPEATLKKDSVLGPDAIERVREARNVLIRNFENPPSLLELARQVGTNKTTLNQGFRKIFGTSAFDYLRIRRLERARELLESKKMNVTEAAFDVGYSQQSNFTKAFKNHFGTNPTDHLH